MSIYTQIRIGCDGCGNSTPIYDDVCTQEMMVKVAKEFGWVVAQSPTKYYAFCCKACFNETDVADLYLDDQTGEPFYVI